VFFFSRSVRKSAEEVSWTTRVGVEDRVGRRFDGGSGRSGDHHDGDHDDSLCERGRSRSGRGGHRDRRQCTGHGWSYHDRHRTGRSDRDQRWQRVHIVRRDRSHFAGAPDQLRLHRRADQDTAPETRGISCNYFLRYIIIIIREFMKAERDQYIGTYRPSP